MEINKKIDGMREELIESTQELLRIKSVEGEAKENAPFGEGVAKALDCALNISKSLGFNTTNLDGYIGYAEYGEGEDYVAVLGHLDVVPEGDGWAHPAYAAEIHDGKIYARGSLDDKGPIMAALYGLKAIKDLNLPLSKRVRIIFGTNEETGSSEMEYYSKREKPPVAGFTPDAEYPIIYAEKGLTSFDVIKDFNVKAEGDVKISYIKGGSRSNVVPDYCEAGLIVKNEAAILKAVEDFSKKTGFNIKAEVNNSMVIVKSVGASAHGSTPELGKNAIMQLFALLGEVLKEESDVTSFIKFLNDKVGFETNGKSFGVGLKDEPSGELSFNVGTINMDENKVSMAFNLRYPVTFKFEDMMNPFDETIKGTGIRVENMAHHEPLYFPEDHSLITSLQKVYTEQTGQKADLLAIGGGTYAKSIPNVVAFGPLFPGKPDVIHMPNEYIEVEDLILNAKIYAHAIYELAK